ncbi:RNA-binding domain-containing protein [Crassisporium funariophilum]|nr:RNA-binding domain-containing protein [Crassisporium funariophilum]
MEEGSKSKKTVFVGGISDDTDETALYESFSTFGDIIEVQLPPPATTHHHYQNASTNKAKHRGFAFVTFGSSADAQDAIDNMDMNELKGRVLKVNLARPMKGTLQPGGNRAVWESEEWLKEHVKPLAQSGGKFTHAL